MSQQVTNTKSAFAPFNLSPLAKLWLGAALVGPIASIGIWWLWVDRLQTDTGGTNVLAPTIVLPVLAAAALIAYGRRRAIDPLWIVTAVLAFVPITAALAFLSFFVALSIACGNGGCG